MVGPEAGAPATQLREALQCSKCSERNPTGSAYCWRCFTPFPGGSPRPSPGAMGGTFGAQDQAPGIGSAGYVPPGYAMPPGSPGRIGMPLPETSAEGPSPKWMKVVAIGLAVLVLAAGGYVAVLARGHGTRLHVPTEIAGAAQVATPATIQAVARIRQEAARRGLSAYAGFYGLEGVPSIAFLAYDYQRKDGETIDQLWGQFAGPFVTAVGRTRIDPDTATSSSDGTADYVCARVTGRARGALCMWQDTGSIGLLIQYHRSVTEAQLMAATVRTTVET